MFKPVITASALALALASFAGTGPARAADYDMSTWDGFYVGLHAGYGWFDASGTGPGGTWSASIGDGPMGGVLVGYNWDLGNYVIGFEADASFGDQSTFTAVPGLGNMRVSNHGQHTFRLRAGAEIGSGLAYLTGGLALADVWATSGAVQDKEFLIGGVVGAGYEAMLTQDISLRAEYLFATFADQTYQVGAPVSVDYSTHTFRAGVAWRF